MSTKATSTNTTRDRTGARQSRTSRCRSRRPLSLLASLLAVVVLNGCDLDVINPGPVQDGALDNPSAFDGLINGMKRTLTETLHHVGIKSAIRTRQLHAGLNDTWGRVNNDMHFGITHDEPFWDPWPRMQDARWLGEDALRRAAVIWPDAATMASTPAVAEANLWTGFTYRFFGDFYCEVAFDGGAAQDNDVAYQLAEQAFTDAINIATAAGHDEFLNAGLAGRGVRPHPSRRLVWRVPGRGSSPDRLLPRDRIHRPGRPSASELLRRGRFQAPTHDVAHLLRRLLHADRRPADALVRGSREPRRHHPPRPLDRDRRSTAAADEVSDHHGPDGSCQRSGDAPD